MSTSDPGAGPAPRRRSAPTRLVHVWRGLPSERRFAAFAAVGLFLTLFLPWYQETVIATGLTHLQSVSASLTGWGAFSFVEAAVLVVAIGVLTLLFVRAEGGAFHVPGGDGGVITAAGVWTCVLIIWRMFDKEGTIGHGQYATTSGIDWGIFIALGVAVALTYAGTRIRRAHEPEPALPGDPEEPVPRATVVRTPDMEADDTWTMQPLRKPAAPPAAPARAPHAALERSPSEAATAVVRAVDPPAAASGERPRVRPRSVGAPALDRREIQELDLAEPPTARLGESTRRRSDPDDPTLT